MVDGQNLTAKNGYVYGQNLSNNNGVQNFIWEQFMLIAHADTTSAGKNGFFGMDFFTHHEEHGLGDAPITRDYKTNPPSGESFKYMGVSLYFDEGAITLSGTPSSFTLEPVLKTVNIVAANADVKPLRQQYLHDDDLTTFWNNDG